MTQHNPTKLTEEEVVAVYNKEFKEEYDAMVDNIRTLAKGNTTFANTWKEWLGIGSISASVIGINAIFAILVAVGLISGFVTLGVGIAVAVVGVIAGIMFQKYRINKNMEKYLGAEYFVENELLPDNLEALRSKLQQELYPVLKDASPDQINYIVKSVIASLESLIINKQVKTFADLESNSVRDLLLASTQKTPAVALNTKLINSILAKLPVPANSVSKAPLKKNSDSKKSLRLPQKTILPASGHSMWSRPVTSEEEYQKSIENDFNNNSMSL